MKEYTVFYSGNLESINDNKNKIKDTGTMNGLRTCEADSIEELFPALRERLESECKDAGWVFSLLNFNILKTVEL